MGTTYPKSLTPMKRRHWRHSWPARYCFAVLAVAAATLLRYMLGTKLGFTLPFILYYPAIMLAALLGGFGPGMLATVVSIASGCYLFWAQIVAIAGTSGRWITWLVLVFLAGTLLSSVGELARRHRRHLREFERVVEGLEEMIVVVDRNYRYVIANQTFLNYRGMKREQVVGRRVDEVVTPEVFQATVKERMDECFRGKVVQYDLRYNFPVMGERDLSVSYFPLEGPTGVERLACVLRDVTEKNRATEAIQASEDRYRDLVEHSEDLVCTHDLEGNLISVNSAPARILGYSAEELVKIPMRDLLVPEGRELFEQYLERFRTTGEPQSGLLCVVTRSGEVRTWEYHNTLRTDGVDKPIVRGMARDITERRRAELALRRSEERYRMLFEKSIAGVAICSTDGLLVESNVAWARMLGYDSPEEVRGRPTSEFYVNLADRQPLLEELERTGACLGRELQLRRKDGTGVWVLFDCCLRQADSGSPVLQATAIDITERKRAEDALRLREEDYRRFVAQSSEGIFREDMDAPVSVNLPEDELVHHILYDSYMAECNDAQARMYGVTSGQELLGKRLIEMLDPNDERNIALTREYIRSGFHILERESHETDLQGNPKVFRNSMIGIVENGMLVRTWGIQRDVTEQVKLEEARTEAVEALRKSEEHFRLLVEQALDGIFIADSRGKYLDVNSAGAGMLGYTREEILRLSITDIVATEQNAGVEAERDRLLDGRSVRNEWTFRRKDGSLFPGEVVGRQLPDGRLQGILRDITERKRAEEALQRNEERFRFALKDSPVTVFNQDRDLRYTWVYNQPAEWGENVLGKTSDEVMEAKSATLLNKMNRRAMETGQRQRGDLNLKREGFRQDFVVTIEAMRDSTGTIMGTTGSLIDVARLRELAERLEEQRDRLALEKLYLEAEIEAELGFEEIIGQSQALREVLKQARVVAPTDSTVLLLGETGTGKELMARAIHALSSRQGKSFIKLNCAAVPSGLLESELFGHEKGAFTGAVSQKVGRLELADGGSLFLDEIGELPLELQPKLLRVLQDREFERLGGVRTLKVDVRIISATNCDLAREVANKNFREDLFYRLNVFPIELPPLRERRSDIPSLVSHFVRKHSVRMGRRIDRIPRETMTLLRDWNWPGNVRELENIIERMVILSKDNVLAPPPVELQSPQETAEDNLTEIEREHIIRVLRETNGVVAGEDGAASRLGIKRTTLQSMLKRFGIEPDEYRRGTGTFGR